MGTPPKFDGDDASRQKLQPMARDPKVASVMGRPAEPVLSSEVPAGKPAFLSTNEYDLGQKIMRGEAAPLPSVPERKDRGQPPAPPPPAEVSVSTSAGGLTADPSAQKLKTATDQVDPARLPHSLRAQEERAQSGGRKATSILLVGLAVFLIAGVFVIAYAVSQRPGPSASSATATTSSSIPPNVVSTNELPVTAASAAPPTASAAIPATASSPSGEPTQRSGPPPGTQSVPRPLPPPSAPPPVISSTPAPSSTDGLMFKPK